MTDPDPDPDIDLLQPPAPEAPVTVVLADGHQAARAGIRRALEPDGIIVVAEADSAGGAIDACVAHRPRVCVVAAALSGGGIEATRAIADAVTETSIVMVTELAEREELFAALRAGAIGYLQMTASAARLPHIVRSVANGEAVLPRELSAPIVAEFRGRGNRRSVLLPATGETVELTARELEVLERLRKRERTSEIAAALGISEITVRRHVSAIVHKLGAADRRGALAMLEPEADTGRDRDPA